jgi:hypothetical protein
MNKPNSNKPAKAIVCLVDGNIIRATVRIADIAKNTVLKLLADIGRGCSIQLKKAVKREHALAIFFGCYNSCRIHQTPRVTLASEAGVTDHVWSPSNVISLAKQ